MPESEPSGLTEDVNLQIAWFHSLTGQNENDTKVLLDGDINLLHIMQVLLMFRWNPNFDFS